MSTTIPARIIARVYRDYADTTGYPYHYTVDAYVPGDPEPAVIDYGSHPNRDLAWGSIEWVLTHRDQCDNPEYVHTRALTAYAGPDKLPAYRAFPAALPWSPSPTESADDDEEIGVVEADGYIVYVRRAPNGSILVDVDNLRGHVPPLILSADDITYRNDEKRTA